MLEFGTPSWSQSRLATGKTGLNFQEQREDLEHDQARNQSIHGHGRGETYYTHCAPPMGASNHRFALYSAKLP